MARKRFGFDLALPAPRPGATLFRWLYEDVRAAVLEGRLTRGMRLPSTRELARQYGVSRGTVVGVFEQLRSEGYLESGVGGAGTFVSRQLPEDSLASVPGPAAFGRPGKPPALSRLARRLEVPPKLYATLRRPFQPYEVAVEEFPLDLWAQLLSRRVRRATRSFLADSDWCGYRPLREAIASYLGAARGVRCSPDEVVIVNGIQHAFELTTKLLLDPGDPVWVEDPCATIVSSIVKIMGARIVPVPVDDHGIDVATGLRRCERAKVAYVTPAHQFPLGVTTTLDRRLALLDWSQRTGSVIFEDDYGSGYRYTARPIPALQSLDRHGSVILAGSFSKVLLPSLRLGYVVARADLAEKLAAARFFVDRHSSVIDQATMCDFIAEGHFGRHLRRMRELYATRLGILQEAVQRRLRGLLELQSIEAGLHTVGWLGPGLEAEAVARAAAQQGVDAVPLSRFVLKKPRREGLLIGFAAFDAEALRQGVDRLAVAFERSARTVGGLNQRGRFGSFPKRLEYLRQVSSKRNG